MATRSFQDDFKLQLKSQADIVRVIQHFIPLQRQGNLFMASCPFHDDKNPSFQVNPDTNTFHCHSCKAGSRMHSTVQSSDVYGFLKGMLHCNLGDAIEWLANFLGQPLPALDPSQQLQVDKQHKWYEYCAIAAERFHQSLLSNKEAMDYLYHRGFTMHDIVTWKLGWGDTVDYDFINTKDRLVFTLFDHNDNISSFTGRVLIPDHVLKDTNLALREANKSIIPKYLDRHPLKADHANYQHHPFPVFEKGTFLYGLHAAKEYLLRWRVAILVEGWTDVIKLHKFGAKHAVSTMGTALTEAQVLLLKRYGVKRVLSMRDGDEAGWKAAMRDSEILAKHGIETLIVPMDSGLDPCDFCEQYHGREEELSLWINNAAMPLHHFQIKRLHSETQESIDFHYARIAELQSTRITQAVRILDSIEDPIDRDIYIRQVSNMFNISYDAVITKLSS